jgi:endoglucanase
LQFAGGGMDATKTTQWFQAPSGVNNPWALQFHYYSPCMSSVLLLLDQVGC